MSSIKSLQDKIHEASRKDFFKDYVKMDKPPLDRIV